MQKDKKISLGELFKSNGLLLPTNADEILIFEKSNDINKETPEDWDNPINIIKRGKIKKLEISNLNLTTESTKNLSMAAREGKAITDEIRKKMNDDREQSKNKQ
ncbi:MAG: hypothetical protein PHD97_00705 [Bacteroidales bacterium]|nr:hypothetical protein [Bacteroidales bacterium]